MTGAGSRPDPAPRHEARERALTLLYEATAKEMSVVDVLRSLPVRPDPFTVELVIGVAEQAGEIDRLIRARIAEGGYPGQPSHPVAHGVGARAHEPPFAHQAAEGKMAANMVFAIEPGAYWEEGGGLRLEDDYLITGGKAERLGTFRDDFREDLRRTGC